MIIPATWFDCFLMMFPYAVGQVMGAWPYETAMESISSGCFVLVVGATLLWMIGRLCQKNEVAR